MKILPRNDIGADYEFVARKQRRILVASDRQETIADVSRIWDSSSDVRLETCSLSTAIEVLTDRVEPDVLIVDLEEANALTVSVLDHVNGLAHGRGQHGLVLFTRDCLDVVAASVTAGSLSLLCDPTPVERAAAIGFAVSHSATRVRETHDVASDGLQTLAQEVARIAKALAALAGEVPHAGADAFSDGLIGYRAEPATKAVSQTPVSASEVRAMIRVRRLRERYFPADLFADPAWDMLLDLFAARIERTPVAVSSLCIAAAVPPTTALRTIRAMTDAGLFARVDDPTDRRRVFIELTERSAAAMQEYVAAARAIS